MTCMHAHAVYTIPSFPSPSQAWGRGCFEYYKDVQGRIALQLYVVIEIDLHMIFLLHGNPVMCGETGYFD